MSATKARPPDPWIYSSGLCAMSVCTTIKDVAELEAKVNAIHPTGISSRWTHSDEPFSGGESNPCPCPQASEHGENRQHYLLSC